MLLAVALWFVWCRRCRTNKLLRAALGVGAGGFGLISALLLVSGSGLYWYYNRSQPAPFTDRPLFQGISYSRDVRDTPRPLVIHVIKIDLTTPGLSFLVTPRQPTKGYDLPARTTSQFLDEFGLQLAVNGSYFTPWWSNSILDYYPHVGEPASPLGFAVSRGDRYGLQGEKYPLLMISLDNRVTFGLPDGATFNAVAGNDYLLQNGQMPDKLPAFKNRDVLHPRTAVGLDQAGTILIIMVVDGRQPNYSEGVILFELAGLMQEYGAYTALNLDGGGSSTLVIEGDGGEPEVLNSPIQNNVPGRERPVATHLGIYALPLEK